MLNIANRWIEAAAPHNAEDEARRAGASLRAIRAGAKNEQNVKHHGPLEHEEE